MSCAGYSPTMLNEPRRGASCVGCGRKGERWKRGWGRNLLKVSPQLAQLHPDPHLTRCINQSSLVPYVIQLPCPAAPQATAAQPFQHIVMRLAGLIAEPVAAGDPPVARGVHQVIVLLDDAAFLVAMILAELADPVPERGEHPQASRREGIPDFVDAGFDGGFGGLQRQAQFAVHFHQCAAVDLRAAQTARIYYARDPLPNRFD